MVVGPSPHRVHKRDLVHFRGHVWKNLRNILSPVSILLEFETAWHDRTRTAVVNAHISCQDLACVLFGGGLIVKGLHLADPAGIEDRNDGFRARLEMRGLRRKRIAADR